MPSEIALKQKIGRYANSPTNFNYSMNVKKDEMLHEFQQQNELNYLKDQVRRMESPDMSIPNVQDQINLAAGETSVEA